MHKWRVKPHLLYRHHSMVMHISILWETSLYQGISPTIKVSRFPPLIIRDCIIGEVIIMFPWNIRKMIVGLTTGYNIKAVANSKNIRTAPLIIYCSIRALAFKRDYSKWEMELGQQMAKMSGHILFDVFVPMAYFGLKQEHFVQNLQKHDSIYKSLALQVTGQVLEDINCFLIQYIINLLFVIADQMCTNLTYR